MGCHARALDTDVFGRLPLVRRSSPGANPALGNAKSLTPVFRRGARHPPTNAATAQLQPGRRPWVGHVGV